ncbi:MAG TPA: hypothetical protein VMU42_17465 [Candidatus Sulfotelmatobacter sp.]|nr:hypothetical protein [Candidatus Sulfotelmatobacter sp.]
MQTSSALDQDEVAWQTRQEIANRQFRALLRADAQRRRADAWRDAPRWKRLVCALFGIEPKLPEFSNLPGGYP